MASPFDDESLAPFHEMVKNNPPCTIKEETALSRIIRDKLGDVHAAQRRLVLSHIPLVIKIARTFRNSGLPLNDLVQEGIVGLYRAATPKFEPEKGRFGTYGFAWIKEAIRSYVRENKGVVRAPATAHRKRDLLNRVIASHTKDGVVAHGEVQKILKMKPGKIAMLQGLGVESSLNTVIGDGETEVINLLVDPNPVEPFAFSEESAVFASLNEALGTLKPREQRIVMARFGMGEKEDEIATLDKLAVEFSLTRERIRQIQVQALQKLKESPQAAFMHQFFE